MGISTIAHKLHQNPFVYMLYITLHYLLTYLFKGKPKNFSSATSLRVIFLFWCFACLLIGNYYACYLYSIMTFPVFNSPIDTIEKLANEQVNGRIQVIAPESSFYYKNLKVYNNLAK